VDCHKSGQKPIALKGSSGKEKYCLARKAIVDQRHLQSARGSRDASGEPMLVLELTEQGGQLMQKATRRMLEEHETKGDMPRLAILTNGELLSAATLRSVIVDALVVQGNFSQDDVDELVELLTGKGKDRMPNRQKT
jgi:preprotein translocase subunit SecD